MIFRRLWTVIAAAMLGTVLCLSASAQEPAPTEDIQAPNSAPALRTPQAAEAATQVDVTQDQTQNPPSTSTKSQSSSSSSSQAPAPDYNWHVSISPYLWFPGLHGRVGGANHNASVHASAGDLLSHFRFGIMGSASADVRVGELIWTSKIGARLIDKEKFKADANIGVRFFHLGTKLNFNP